MEQLVRVIETGYPGSFFFVNNYGRSEGDTTYAELQQNPHFVLPYMEATSAPSA